MDELLEEYEHNRMELLKEKLMIKQKIEEKEKEAKELLQGEKNLKNVKK